MQYINHNFYSNFTSAIASKENGTAMDMIAKEISDLMVDDFDNFVVTIGKSGIKISKEMTDEDIVDTILDKIDKNDNLAKLLAFAFADHNNVINNKKTTQSPTIQDVTLWKKSTDTIADGIGKIAVDLKQDRTLKTTLKKDILEQIEDKAKEKGNRKRTIYNSSQTNKKALMWFGIGMLAITITYFTIKHFKNKKVQKLALGGGFGAPALGVAPPPPFVPAMPPPPIAPSPVVGVSSAGAMPIATG